MDGKCIVTGSLDPGDTRVSLETTEGLSLLAKWEEMDRLDIYINDERIEKRMPISNISEDGRTCSFGIDLSKEKYPGKCQMICVTENTNAVQENGELYLNASLLRSPIHKFRAPVYSFDTIDNRENVTVHFIHYQTYEVVHVRNESSEDIVFSLHGYQLTGDAKTWFASKRAIPLGGEGYSVDSRAAADPVFESEPMTIPASGEDIVVSSYTCIGDKMTNAQMVASIDGKIVHSSNVLSSNVQFQVGHAYHIYVCWDGQELFYVGGLSEVDAGGNGYGSDSNGNINGTGIGYGSADTGTITGGGSGYENGN